MLNGDKSGIGRNPWQEMALSQEQQNRCHVYGLIMLFSILGQFHPFLVKS